MVEMVRNRQLCTSNVFIKYQKVKIITFNTSQQCLTSSTADNYDPQLRTGKMASKNTQKGRSVAGELVLIILLPHVTSKRQIKLIDLSISWRGCYFQLHVPCGDPYCPRAIETSQIGTKSADLNPPTFPSTHRIRKRFFFRFSSRKLHVKVPSKGPSSSPAPYSNAENRCSTL